MPRGDKTGPMGMGAMSGRGAGYCTGAGRPGYANRIPRQRFGIGFSRGRGLGGGGRGWRHQFLAAGLPGWMRFGGYGPLDQKPDPEREKQALKSQADALEATLAAIKERLSKMEAAL